MGELLPLILLVIALIPKIKKKQWGQKIEKMLNDGMKTSADLLPEKQAAVTKSAKEALKPMAEQQKRTLPESVSVSRKEEFHSSFTSRPETIVLDEGVDPCHDGLYEDDVEEEQLLGSMPEPEVQLQNQELIRGIVLGEILSKPRYRAFARK